jgi:hypothetical protein
MRLDARSQCARTAAFVTQSHRVASGFSSSPPSPPPLSSPSADVLPPPPIGAALPSRWRMASSLRKGSAGIGHVTRERASAGRLGIRPRGHSTWWLLASGSSTLRHSRVGSGSGGTRSDRSSRADAHGDEAAAGAAAPAKSSSRVCLDSSRSAEPEGSAVSSASSASRSCRACRERSSNSIALCVKYGVRKPPKGAASQFFGWLLGVKILPPRRPAPRDPLAGTRVVLASA